VETGVLKRKEKMIED